MAGSIAYRKLPGHRRGFIRGSTVWLGPDHLLLVKSLRFREEYKRYYFRDVQAIVLADAPRFHLSTRAAFIGYLWLLAFVMTFRLPNGPSITGGIGIALVIAWVYLSAACSCTCRIYTAVSRDKLPSVYRTWVAARFLHAVEPHITAVQGAMDRTTESLETLSIGPPATVPGSLASASQQEIEERMQLEHGSISYYLLLAILFGDALWRWRTLSYAAQWASTLTTLLPLAIVAAAIYVIVQCHWKRVTDGQQKFAIAALVVTAITGYGGVMANRLVAAIRSTPTRQPVDPTPFLHVAGEVQLGISLALGLAGVVVLLAGRGVDRKSHTLSLS